jgi:Nucleotide modification associated domain 3
VKLIFSRKGFDSSAGGVPSPLVDGRPISLPIPTRMPTPTRFGDLSNGVADLVSDLTRGRIAADRPCHLDPDLDASSLVRQPRWRGALGQVFAAQSHLSNNDVGIGDVFLFWGLYQPAVRSQTGSWSFAGIAEHRLFGWLQIDEVLTIGEDPLPVLTSYPWLRSHPHLATGWPANNTVYVARERLALPGRAVDLPGFGVLNRGLRLTAPASTQPSLWAVPPWLHPLRGGTSMSYHPTERWNRDGTLRSAARGQEFVADVGNRHDAIDWLLQVLRGETES